MTTRLETEAQIARTYLPGNTRKDEMDGRIVWVFKKSTEVGMVFTIAIYFDPDEPGYVAQCLHPVIEDRFKTPHIGHIFSDGVICLGKTSINGKTSMRATGSMLTAYSKSCLWAEGIALMIESERVDEPTEFPFSENNGPDEV